MPRILALAVIGLSLVALAGEPRPRKAIIYGGGVTAAEADVWLQRWKHDSMELDVSAGAGFPKIVETATVQGLKPGFHVVVLGYCAAPEGDLVTAMIKGFYPGTYSRDVIVDADDEACPPRSSDVRVKSSVTNTDANGFQLIYSVFVWTKHAENETAAEYYPESPRIFLRDKSGTLLDRKNLWAEPAKNYVAKTTMRKEPGGAYLFTATYVYATLGKKDCVSEARIFHDGVKLVLTQTDTGARAGKCGEWYWRW